MKPTARIAGKPPADAGQGRSADGTLIYEWKVAASGERHFKAKLWNGSDYRIILDQKISAPRPTGTTPLEINSVGLTSRRSCNV